MSTPEHDESQEAGKHESTDRPEGTVDEDANPPLTDPTKTDADSDQGLIPPQDSGSSAGPGTAGPGEDEQQSPK